MPNHTQKEYEMALPGGDPDAWDALDEQLAEILNWPLSGTFHSARNQERLWKRLQDNLVRFPSFVQQSIASHAGEKGDNAGWQAIWNYTLHLHHMKTRKSKSAKQEHRDIIITTGDASVDNLIAVAATPVCSEGGAQKSAHKRTLGPSSTPSIKRRKRIYSPENKLGTDHDAIVGGDDGCIIIGNATAKGL
ncbi:hypothetical protein BP00DRAFT_444583 [Aspergillus indologenus CBS 114.80]|uniref:Uncharacterized protein n=1 Tax=Aspergillus indologenus CBS 114.80 TaxID=1450541 RepID=A0A2V5IA82_9EURO|nr:hypothetical protein BP00DRAFT_444583 [Aspergillus indologenus CBS 114.80]